MSLIVPLDSRGRPAPVRIRRPSETKSASRSAARALDVLELFGGERRSLRAIEIARALALGPSTANQLLKTMVNSAHLLFDARAMTYRPSPRLAGFGGWIVASYGPDERLRALVRDAAARAGRIVTLTTANDLFMQILDVAAPADMAIERGQRISLFGSAIGSAWLSMQSEDELERLAARARLPASELPRVHATLAAIRRDGFADGTTGAIRDGIWSIAIPLPEGGLPVRLVLGLAGPDEAVRLERDTLVALLQAAIARWSAAEDGAPSWK